MTNVKKDYSLDTSTISDSSVIDGPCPWVWQTSVLKIDFRRWQHHHGDLNKSRVERGDFLEQCRHAIWGMRHELTDHSIVTLYESGLKMMMLFIDETNTPINAINDITTEILLSLVYWLKTTRNSRTGTVISYVTARSRYTAIKTLLCYYERQGLFDTRLLPINPFPHVNRASNTVEPYTKFEMQQIMKMLYSELRAIRNNTSLFSQQIQLAVYQLLIYAQTGINKTPLEEASRDSLKPHPLRPDKASILTTYKRRGMSTHILSLRNSYEVDQIQNLSHSVADLIKQALVLTAPLISEAPKELKDRIWLYRHTSTQKIRVFKGTCLNWCAKIMVVHHGLKTSQGNFLFISPKRLRKTFATRMWQLTNGVVSKILLNVV
jgi:integrase